MNKKVLSVVAIIALIAVLGICLVACNADSYAKKLEKADYEVSIMSDSDVDKYNEEAKKDGDPQISWSLTAAKLNVSLSSGIDAGQVSIVKYKKIADAKNAVNDMVKVGAVEGETIVRKGSIVIFGTKAGVAVVA